VSIKFPLLKIQGEGNPPHGFFIVVVQLNQGWSFFFNLLHSFGGGFLWFGGKGGTDVAKVSGFPAAKAESFFLASLALFGGEFGDFDGIYVHRIGVVGF